ncbi:hypothetical protein EES46_26360 [Streptomyces sp. ADI98-10]|nr:hypothetical protein EES46_26360 [Streptomyces sp. ADI98-10]
MPDLDECTFRFRAGNSPVGEARKVGGVVILPAGEEEAKATESEALVISGAWCKREMLRR